MAMENPPFESMYFLVNMVIFKLVMLVFRDVQEVPRLLSLFEKRIWIYKLKQVNQKSQVFDLFTAKFLQGKTSYKWTQPVYSSQISPLPW